MNAHYHLSPVRLLPFVPEGAPHGEGLDVAPLLPGGRGQGPHGGAHPGGLRLHVWPQHLPPAGPVSSTRLRPRPHAGSGGGRQWCAVGVGVVVGERTWVDTLSASFATIDPWVNPGMAVGVGWGRVVVSMQSTYCAIEPFAFCFLVRYSNGIRGKRGLGD